MGERCDNCRFGTMRRYVQPDPLPEPVQKTALFGLLRWQDGPSNTELVIFAIQKDRADNQVPCMLRPTTLAVRKGHWCGEYQEPPK